LQDLCHPLSRSPRRWRILFWPPSPTLPAPKSFAVLVQPSFGLSLAAGRLPRARARPDGWGSGQAEQRTPR